MRSDSVVVLGVRFQTATQMRLAQDNHMIDALTPNRSDQPLSKTTLPRRGWCHGPIAYAHGAQSACDDRTIDGRDNEQVHSGDILNMITQKGAPSLTWRPASLYHVLGDTRLRDVKSKLE